MSGALAERVFAHKLTQVGFRAFEVLERRPFGLADAALYPLFTPELIQLMRDLIAPDRQAQVATAVTIAARKPTSTTAQ